MNEYNWLKSHNKCPVISSVRTFIFQTLCRPWSVLCSTVALEKHCLISLCTASAIFGWNSNKAWLDLLLRLPAYWFLIICGHTGSQPTSETPPGMGATLDIQRQQRMDLLDQQLLLAQYNEARRNSRHQPQVDGCTAKHTHTHWYFTCGIGIVSQMCLCAGWVVTVD